MNDIYSMAEKFSKIIKGFKTSIIKYYNFFMQRKKTVNSIYVTVMQQKKEEIKDLTLQLKDLQDKNSKLEKEVLSIKNSMDKKKKLIKDLQDLTTKRSD